MKAIRWVPFLGLLASCFLTSARAAQTAQVIVPSASVYQYPQATAKVVAKLNQGESVAVSNVPTEGFYKARLQNGDIGWISGNDILSSSGGQMVVPVTPTSTEGRPMPRRRRKSDDTANGEDSFRFLLGYGIESLSYAGIADNYPVTKSLNLGTDLGFEFQFRMARSLYWALRLEILSGNTGSQSISSVLSQTTTVKLIPVELGLVWSPITSHKFRLGIGGYLGAVPAANATITQTNTSTNPSIVNQVVYQTLEACATLAVQMTIGLGDVFGIFLEGAYRYDQTGTTPATNTIGAVPGFKIDYSGVTARAGIEIRL